MKASAPEYKPPPLDPAALAAQTTAQNEQVAALQTRSMGDSASLMARYGMLALAGMSGSSTPAPGAAAVKV